MVVLSSMRALLAALAVTVLSICPVSAEPLRLVTGPGYLPFSDPDLPGGGMLTELVATAAARAGFAATIEFLPWQRGYDATLRGEFDATFPYVWTAERERAVWFSESLFAVQRRVVVLADSPLTSAEPGSLAGYSLCLPLGYALNEEFEAMVRGGSLTIDRVPTMQSCFAKLLGRRVDAIQANSIVADQLGGRIRALPGGLGPIALHAIVPRARLDAQQLLDRLDRALVDLQADGTYDAIVTRHLRHPG